MCYKKLIVGSRSSGEKLSSFLNGRVIRESKATLRQMVGSGKILINGNAVSSGRMVYEGDEIAFMEPVDLGPPPEEVMKLDVLWRGEGHIVINKPYGHTVSPGPDGGDADFYNSLMGYVNRDSEEGGPYVRPHLVHRLDRETSGVLLVALDSQSARELALQFQNRQVRKSYLTVVEGAFPLDACKISIPISKSATSGVRMKADERGGKEAETEVRVVERFEHFTLLRAVPLTGRQHQIRVHLSAAGYPIAVDWLYGRREQMTGEELRDIVKSRDVPLDQIVLGRIPLHAAGLEYRPPGSRERKNVSAPLPDDFKRFLELLHRVDALAA
jgi:23S rRNA pseudouridine1911/1915/1917 synthase